MAVAITEELADIYGPAHLTATAAILFTVPADERWTIRDLHLCNGDTVARTFTMSKGTDAAATRFYDAQSIPTHDAFQRTGAIVLQAGQFIEASASVASKITVMISGVKETV